MKPLTLDTTVPRIILYVCSVIPMQTQHRSIPSDTAAADNKLARNANRRLPSYNGDWRSVEDLGIQMTVTNAY